MKTKVVQSNFLTGVLDPRASGRIDAESYNSALLTGVNIELHHLGGCRRRRGLAHRATLSNVLTRITAGVTVTAPNGGTTANANDDNTATLVTSTTPPGTTNEWVMVQYDLGSAQAVVFADVLGIRTTSGSSIEFRIQGSEDGVVWDNIHGINGTGGDFDLVDTTPRDYRRASLLAAKRYWRVVRIGTVSLAGNVTISGFNLWLDSGTISNSNAVPFEVSSTSRILVTITDRSGVVFENGAFVDYIPLPYVSADIPVLDADSSDGELVITHEDYDPRAIFEDTEDNFQSIEVEFTNLPQIDFNDSLSPTPTSEIQVITLTSPVIGDTFQVSLDGARSAAIVYAGDSNADQQAATAANFAREIQKLYTVPGFDGVTCSRTGAAAYTVTFAGASAKTYELMTVSTLTGSATTSVSRSQPGVPRTEDLWSETRGFPRTVAFYEKRIIFGGTRSKFSSIIGSHVVDTSNFDLAQGLDDEAIFVTLSGPNTTIQSVVGGDSLQVFTTGAEGRYLKRDGEPITPGDTPKQQTPFGSKRIRPVLVDGLTVYVNASGKALRDFRYDYEVDKYRSRSLTSLASHLLDDVVSIAAWNGSQEDELNFVFAVNSDGTAAVLNVRQENEVRALVQWTTQGQFRRVACVQEDIYFVVEREIDGTSYLFLEQLEYDHYTDAGVRGTNSPASTLASALSHLNGTVCRARGDGFVLDDVTPSSGTATLSRSVSEWEVGLEFNPEVTPMPLNSMTPSGPNFMEKRRIVDVKIKVRNSLGLLCNGVRLPDQYWDVDSFDTAPEPFTGVHSLEESTNWDESQEKLVTFTQVDPLPMEILAMAVTMESS